MGAVVADIFRRGWAAGYLRSGLEPEQIAAVLVGAFGGIKDLTDVPDPGNLGKAPLGCPDPHLPVPREVAVLVPDLEEIIMRFDGQTP